MKYKRILLKLSGEALMGNKQFGIDNQRLVQYAKEVKEIAELGVEIGQYHSSIASLASP